jgi:hypothetical protein
MEELDYWRFCEELSIVQASLLVVGEDPSCAGYTEDQEIQNRPQGYEAAKTAICGGLKNFVRYEKEGSEFERKADYMREECSQSYGISEEDDQYLMSLLNRAISGTLVQQTEYDINGNSLGFLDGTVDLDRSMVNVESLKQWLRLKGFTTGFFFPEPIATMDFLDPLNQRYAPKLAASVKAWQAVTDAGKRSPKRALDKWLREHAAEFGLTNEDGKPIENAIEECSKVANWNAKGGATKTPT